MVQKNIKFIPVPIHKGQALIRADSILYCEADNKCTKIILTDRSTITATCCMCKIEHLLEGCHFFRCNKSHLVNCNMVKEFFSENNVRYARLKNGLTVPISRDYYREFKKYMTKLLSDL